MIRNDDPFVILGRELSALYRTPYSKVTVAAVPEPTSAQIRKRARRRAKKILKALDYFCGLSKE